MYVHNKKNGSVLLIVVFIIAMLSAVVVGIAQINTEELVLMTNQINSAKAIQAAYAGLNDTFAQLRSDCDWSDGFSNKSFNGGSYSVTVTGTAPDLTVTSIAQTSESYTAKVIAEVTLSDTSPYVIRIDTLKVNEE